MEQLYLSSSPTRHLSPSSNVSRLIYSVYLFRARIDCVKRHKPPTMLQFGLIRTNVFFLGAEPSLPEKNSIAPEKHCYATCGSGLYAPKTKLWKKCYVQNVPAAAMQHTTLTRFSLISNASLQQMLQNNVFQKLTKTRICQPDEVHTITETVLIFHVI